MCPEVEKRLKKLKDKKPSVAVVKGKGMTRRDLLNVISILPLAPIYLGFLGAENVKAVELDLPFNWGCVKCSVGFCICWKGTPPKPVPSIYNAYWYPVGFIEVNKACEFLTSLLPIMGSLVGSIATQLCGMLPSLWVQQTDVSQNTGIGRLNQQYMRVHARWYGMTPEIEAQVMTYLTTVELCPCPIVDMLKHTALGPAYTQLNQLQNKIQAVQSKVSNALGLSKLLNMIDRVIQVLDAFGDFPLPVWFTEVLSPFWLIDILSPDSILMGGMRTALLSTLSSHPKSKLALCSGIIQKLQSVAPDILGKIDPSFLCVGFWGYGYPRIGVVRNDDPLIAQLLAASRFHHLFSKTIKVIPYGFDYANTRYQLVKPFSSECMKPGCGGFSIPNICELDGNPVSLFNMLKDKAINLIGRTSTAIDRKLFLVVWKRASHCCC